MQRHLGRCKQASWGKNSNAERNKDCSYDIIRIHVRIVVLEKGVKLFNIFMTPMIAD